ncbi:MAG: hypothetical protein M3304_01410 [Actinomycetota bacterium]|nr:hypothetical protein [Actinomycetota bacterium]
MSYEATSGNERPLLGKALRRRWLAIVAAVVLGTVVGAAAGVVWPRAYKSTMTIIIAPLEGDPYSPASVDRLNEANTDVQTDARLAASPAVARLVERALDLARGSLAWRSKLSVTVVPNSQVITISYRAPARRLAKEVAQAFGVSYLRYRAQRSRATVSGQLVALEQRARQTQRRLTAAASGLDPSTSPSNRAYLNQRVAIYTEQLAAFAAEAARLSSASRNPGQVVTPAGEPTVDGLTPPELAALGGFAALLVGLTLAVGREVSDRRLRDPMGVEDVGVPVLGELQVTEPTERSADGYSNEAVEQYRLLRTAVVTHAPAPRVVVLSVLSSTLHSEEVAMPLGEALSRAGHEVTVVLTSPSSRHDAPGNRRPGLGDILLDGADPHSVRAAIASGLYVIEAGRDIDTAAERFVADEMRTALRDLAGRGDYVVVAAPPAGTSGAAALAAVGDEVLVVCELNAATRDDLAASVREVRRVGGKLLGAVVVQRHQRSSGELRRLGKRALRRGRDAAAAPSREQSRIGRRSSERATTSLARPHPTRDRAD